MLRFLVHRITPVFSKPVKPFILAVQAAGAMKTLSFQSRGALGRVSQLPQRCFSVICKVILNSHLPC